MISKTDILLLHAKLVRKMRRAQSIFTGLIEVLETTENWWTALALYIGIIEKAYVRFRDTSVSSFVTKENLCNYPPLRKILLSQKIRYLGGNRFCFSHPRGLGFDCHESALDFFAFASEMDCYYNDLNDVVCEVAGLKFITPFPFGSFTIREIFIDKIYGEPCCDDAVIVDVGAFIGDSSLFFASRGAKLVVAFEPVPALFDILKKNVALNGFEKVISTRDEAVSDNFGTIDIRTRTVYMPTYPVSSSENPLEKKVSFLEVPSIPLSEVITGLGYVDILKMDCEGCEHTALLQAGKNDALKRVGMIIVEVHYDVHSIIELLKCEGFNITKLIQVGKTSWILNAEHRN